MPRSNDELGRIRRARARARQFVAFHVQDIEVNERGYVLMEQLAKFARARDRSTDSAPRRLKMTDDDARSIAAYIWSINARVPGND